MKSMSFIDKAFSFTEKHALFTAPCHLVVAVSGGPDSMALLHTLLCWPHKGLQLSVVHVNHGLRGASAQRDECFVRDFCAAHTIPFTVYHEDVSDYAKEHKLTVEEAGRVLRYLRFEELRQDLNADAIVTAHTASDQAETMLMHLLRGCGLDALCGIPAKRDYVCRPLLSCTREEVLRYCHDAQVPFVLDESNEDTQYTRNRIRHEVLPLLREINPAVDASLLRLQDHIAADVTFLNELAHDLLLQATDGEALRTAPFIGVAQPIRRRAIRLWLRQHQLHTIEESHICAVEHILLSGNGKTLLPGKTTAQVSHGYLTMVTTPEPTAEEPLCLSITDLPVSFTACNNRYTLSVLDSSQHENVHNLFSNRVIDYDTIVGSLMVRTREIGDTLRPAGRGISKSIKKLMNEWNVPTDQRDFYPLVCDDTGVLLVPGYACDQKAAITPTTKRYLVIETQ